MPVLSCADRVGLVDGREDHFEENIYLLNEDYAVVGLREATDPDTPVLSIGDRFFAHFPASPEERASLTRMLSSISEDSLLIRAGGRPVLLLCAFFARTHLLVAIVPQGEIRACFEAPAAYADVLEVLHVRLSGEACVSGEPLDRYRYTVLSEWLRRVHLPLFFEGYQNGRLDTEVQTVATRLAHLALLCGCRLDYDLLGFGYELFDVENLDLFIGTSFAVFLLIHRVGRDRAVVIIGERLPCEGPVLHVRFHCDAPIDTLFEIEALCRNATARDDLFAVYRHPNTSFPLHLQFSFCNKELSAQQIKVKIPFEEKGHSVIVCSVTDEEIFSAQNGENAPKQ